MTLSDTGGEADGGLSLSIDPDKLSELFEQLMGGSGDAALTPDGNLSLIDDIGSSTRSGKQFITVETRNGNVFYLIIDRDDEGEETVHFLNQVDEADLLSLMGDDAPAAETPAVCNCKEKCVAGAVNTNCPVCKIISPSAAARRWWQSRSLNRSSRRKRAAAVCWSSFCCWRWQAAEPSPM